MMFYGIILAESLIQVKKSDVKEINLLRGSHAQNKINTANFLTISSYS